MLSSRESQIPQLVSLKFDHSNMVISKCDFDSNMFYVPPQLDDGHTFIKKVYIMVSLQLLVNFLLISLFYFVPEVNSVAVKYDHLGCVFMGISFCIVLTLVNFERARTTFPINISLLGGFTPCKGLFLDFGSPLISTGPPPRPSPSDREGNVALT